MTPNPLTLATFPIRLAVGVARLGVSIAEHALAELVGRPDTAAAPGNGNGNGNGAPASVSPAAPFPHAAEPEPEPVSEEGPGPSLTVAEPWEGYANMRAEEILARVESSATREEVAVVELYETMHRRRKTVLAAAAQRLKVLSPPQGRP